MTSERILLEGAHNFRDLGGLPGPGGRRVVARRVFRADRLSHLTKADSALLSGLGITRVFDLRSSAELAGDGVGEFAAAGDRHRHVPLVQVALSAGDPTIDWTKINLHDRYLEMLRVGGEVIRTVFEHIAGAGVSGTVFHCTGGKDRTGVLAAVLLRALGVDDEVIVEDYAVSEVYLEPIVRLYRESLEAEGLDPAAILYLCGSPPRRMRDMLTAIDETWGSIDDYLGAIGVTEAIVTELRRRLLG
ncbi:MAG: tyrosine-protein phosphatase [Deltaproteobacteria bacterium]|nr:tyrosine-protein phosphatase [Deltaproteobacteria bacterium]